MYFRLLIITAFLFLTACSLGLQSNAEKIKIITSEAEHFLTVELAETQEEKRLGLMGREELDDGSGMLFVYEENSQPVMWMKDMRISLDILFIGSDLKIRHIAKNVPPCNSASDGQCSRYSSSHPSSMVLEVSAGYTSRHDIEIGDYLQF